MNTTEKHIVRVVLFTFYLLILSSPIYAQWGIGASYEERNETPKKGFGVHLEKDLFESLPVFFVRARVHYSQFSSEASLRFDDELVIGDLETHDLGIALLGGGNLGFFSPYAGIGFGIENWDYKATGINEKDDTGYYYGLVGVSLSFMPVIKPFLEYRVTNYQDISAAKKEIGEGRSRVHIGITLRF